MATQSQDNGFLYFIVGGLVVVVAIVGFIYLNNGDISAPDAPTIIERTEHTIERAPENNTSSNSLELKVDENGASATTTKQD